MVGRLAGWAVLLVPNRGPVRTSATSPARLAAHPAHTRTGAAPSMVAGCNTVLTLWTPESVPEVLPLRSCSEGRSRRPPWRRMWDKTPER